MKFPELWADDVAARVAQVKLDWTVPGLVVLLYKDARCDMRILDETVGPENWQREHYECKGNLFCRVGINVNYRHPDQEPRWVWKSDCGTESNTEAQKGEASDSFKRACFNWGIGRELYTAPRIWIKQKDSNGNPNFEVESDEKGRKRPKLSLVVTGLESTDGKLTYLEIQNALLKKTVYAWRAKQ